MHEDLNREKMHKAIDTTLSGLNGDPWMFRRISARAGEGEIQVKKKLSIGLVLAIVLLLIAAAALGVTLVSQLTKPEVVQNVMEEKAVPLATNNDTGAAVNGMFSAEELAELVRELNENGITLDETNIIMQLLQNGQSYYEEETIMEICRQAFGGNIGTWTLEQQDWYGRLMVKIGYLESYESCLPGEGNMTYEEAETFAFGKIRTEYGADLPLEDRNIWQLERSFYLEYPDDPEGETWFFELNPRDLEHGWYAVNFRDHDPEGTAEVRANVRDWTGHYSGDDLLEAFRSVYGWRQGQWPEEAWQKLDMMMENAEIDPDSWYLQELRAYRMTDYPEPGDTDISRETAIRNAREAMEDPRAALDGAVLAEYDGERQWMVSFIIYSPEDGTKDDAAGLYVISVGSADGEIRNVRKQGLYDSEAFAYVPEAAYEKAWDGILRGDDVVRMATDAALEKYPELDLTNEDKYELIADSFGSWYVTFRAKDVHLASVSVDFSPEGEILSVEADSTESDGDQMFNRYWQVYGYFGEWDQSVWVQLEKDMASLEPETIEGKLLKETRYPDESSVKIRKEEAKELGITATGKRVAEVNTCVLVDADPHPVWIMRILTEDEPEPVIGIDAETGEVAFTEQYKVDYTPHYVLYSMPQTWRKTELEMLGAPHMAKTAITCRFADMWLDYPEIEVDNPENWEMEQDGLTIRFTGRWKGMKDYEVELDENGFVLRCEETESSASEEKPGGWPEEEGEQ